MLNSTDNDKKLRLEKALENLISNNLINLKDIEEFNAACCEAQNIKYISPNDVKVFDALTIITPQNKRDDKGVIIINDALEGYRINIEEYQDPTKNNQRILNNASDILGDLNRQAKYIEAINFLNTIEETLLKSNDNDHDHVRKINSCKEVINEKLIEEILADFPGSKKEIYINSGSLDHLTVRKIFEKEGKLYCTEYNAGGGCIKTENGYAIHTTRELKIDGKDKGLFLRDFIKANNRLLEREFNGTSKRNFDDQYLKPPKSEDCLVGSPQNQGNCSARNIREMVFALYLEEYKSPELAVTEFRKFYDHNIKQELEKNYNKEPSVEDLKKLFNPVIKNNNIILSFHPSDLNGYLLEDIYKNILSGGQKDFVSKPTYNPQTNKMQISVSGALFNSFP